MRKTIFISSALVILALSMNSCKKCYICTMTTQETINNVTDSTVLLKTEVCSGKNGAGANANVAIQDLESNGYTCTPK